MTIGTKWLTIATIALLALFFAVWIGYAMWSHSKTSLIIHTSPMNVDVTINGKKYSGKKSGSSYQVPQGATLSIIIHRDGFVDRHIDDYSVPENEQEVHMHVPLDPQTNKARAVLEKEADHREDILNNWSSDLAEHIEQDNPILTELPYHGTYVVVSQGISVQNPAAEGRFALYIDLYEGYEELGKEEAAAFMRGKGYNPEDYEIIYTASKYEGRYEEFDDRYIDTVQP